MTDFAPKLNRPAACRGAAAIITMLGLIGANTEGGGDHDVAKVLVDSELDLDELVKFALAKLVEQHR